MLPLVRGVASSFEYGVLNTILLARLNGKGAKRFRGDATSETFSHLGAQKWRFLDTGNNYSIFLAQNVATFSKRGLQISLAQK